MKKRNNFRFIKAFTAFVIISIVIISIASYFILNQKIIPPLTFMGLGVINLFILKSSKIKIRDVYPDILYGIVDNGVFVFAAIIGGVYGGVIGAVIGGAAGNTVADGFGGLFEGEATERLKEKKINNKRTALSTMLGKITGCLFGAGIAITIAEIIRLV